MLAQMSAHAAMKIVQVAVVTLAWMSSARPHTTSRPKMTAASASRSAKLRLRAPGAHQGITANRTARADGGMCASMYRPGRSLGERIKVGQRDRGESPAPYLALAEKRYIGLPSIDPSVDQG
jgi:hypothetical protein